MTFGKIDPWHIDGGNKTIAIGRIGEFSRVVDGYEYYKIKVEIRSMKQFPKFPIIQTLEIDGREFWLALEPDDSILAIIISNQVSIYRTRDMKVLHSFEINECANEVKFSPQGKYLAIVDCDYTLNVYETNEWNLVWKSTDMCSDFGYNPISLPALFDSEDEHILYQVSPRHGDFNQVMIVDKEWVDTIRVHDGTNFTRSIAISPDMKFMAATISKRHDSYPPIEGHIRVMSYPVGYHLTKLEKSSPEWSYPLSVAFSSDSRYLSSIWSNGDVIAWEIGSKGRFAEFRNRIGDLLSRETEEVKSSQDSELSETAHRFGERSVWLGVTIIFTVISVYVGQSCGIPLLLLAIWFLLIPGLCCMIHFRRK
jgi:WD40 repeat protein